MTYSSAKKRGKAAQQLLLKTPQLQSPNAAARSIAARHTPKSPVQSIAHRSGWAGFVMSKLHGAINVPAFDADCVITSDVHVTTNSAMKFRCLLRPILSVYCHLKSEVAMEICFTSHVPTSVEHVPA